MTSWIVHCNELVYHYTLGMKFFDTARIRITSGAGGDGAISARREAGIPFGGPNGGNGGVGGDIVFVANQHLNTLLDYKFRNLRVADHGHHGKWKDQYGAGAQPLILEVPIGTIIRESQTHHILHQLLDHGDRWIALKGGDGGVGNMHFKNSVTQYPDFGLMGEPGQTMDIDLELQLLGDVGLIGTPSVGKSSIINTVSNAKVKVADYHFTTLVPNLGSVQVQDINFNIIDIPGLIAGASSGKWLGVEFLRHILKAKIFCFVLDMTRYDDGIHDFHIIWSEITQYITHLLIGSKDFWAPVDTVMLQIDVRGSERFFEVYNTTGPEPVLLIQKVLCRVINKIDDTDDAEVRSYYLSTLQKSIVTTLTPYATRPFDIDPVPMLVSTMTREGITSLKQARYHILTTCDILSYSMIDTVHPVTALSPWITDITTDENHYLVHHGYVEPDEESLIATKVWSVRHPELVRLVYMLPRWNDQWEMRFRKTVHKMWLTKWLTKGGIQFGDILKVHPHYNTVEVRYIKYES